MLERADIIYLYDGSYEGFLCCIYRAFARKQRPMNILRQDAAQLMLYETVQIETDEVLSLRMEKVLCDWAGEVGYEQVYLGFMTCCPDKERLILDYAALCERQGRRTAYMLADSTVNRLQRAVAHLKQEAHLLTGFIRFTITEGGLTAVIRPKNFVLPLLKDHFCDRYRNENFIIYDETHRSALVYCGGRVGIIAAEEYLPPAEVAEEAHFRELWRLFHRTVSIKERYNPKGQMSQMPKRYWPCMTEMRERAEALPGKETRQLRERSG